MITRLESFLEEVSEKTTQSDQYPVLTSSKNGLFLQDGYFNKQVASKDNKGYKIIRRGEFTYRAMSDTGEFYPNMLECAEIGIVSPAYPVFRISNDIILPDYLKYYFRSSSFQKSITSFVQGSTRASMKFAKMKTIGIDLPSKEDQQKIVLRLDLVRNQIKAKTEELIQLDDLIKARFVEMFGDGFETIELRNICKTTSGGTPSTKNPDYYNGTIPWVTTTALGPNHIDGTKAKAYISEEAVANSATKIIPSGSILFGIRVGVGKTSINDVDICTNQDIVAIMDVNETKFSKLFIKHVLDANRAHYDSMKKGATILGITSDDLKNTPIPLAPIKAQKDFETFVEQVDKSKFALGNELAMGNFYIRLIYDRIMHGRVDLRMA